MVQEKNTFDLIELAYKTGKIKDLEDAFYNNPVQEEWHKGKIENILKEPKSLYSYGIGDIVFVKKYNYETGKEGNNHLFVIIDQNNIAVPIENFGMLISSNLDKLKYNSNKLLEKDEKNGLAKDSIVKTDFIYKIPNEQIIFKIGNVDLDRVNEYKQAFYNNLKS